MIVFGQLQSLVGRFNILMSNQVRSSYVDKIKEGYCLVMVFRVY